MALFRRAQKPFRRLAQIGGNAGTGGIEAADNKLRFDIAKLSCSLIPICGLPKIRLDAFAAGIKFGKTDDGGQVILLCGLAKVGFSLVDILRQSFAAEVHERGLVQAAHFTLLRRLNKEPRGLFSIGRSAHGR